MARRRKDQEGASRMPERMEAPMREVRERMADSCASAAAVREGGEVRDGEGAMRSGWERRETKMGGWKVTRTSLRKRFRWR